MAPPRSSRRARRSRPPAGESLRERNKREKRERLLRAARDLFTRKGFDAATAREICGRARVATGTLFLYARDKRDLLMLVFREDAHRLWEEARAGVEEQTPLLEALSRLFGAFIAYYAAHPALARSLAEQMFAGSRGPGELGSLNEEFLAHVVALVERAQRRGELRADRPAATLAAAFFAHYGHWMLAWLVTRAVSRREAEAALRDALGLQLEGLRPPRPPRAR